MYSRNETSKESALHHNADRYLTRGDLIAALEEKQNDVEAPVILAQPPALPGAPRALTDCRSAENLESSEVKLVVLCQV